MQRFQWAKSFLYILPRFIGEMIVGGFVLFCLLVVTEFVRNVLRELGVEWIGEMIRWPFLVLNYPLLLLLLPFSCGQDQEMFAFLVVLPTAVVYNCSLFALFCEAVRFYIKRKKRTENSNKDTVENHPIDNTL